MKSQTKFKNRYFGLRHGESTKHEHNLCVSWPEPKPYGLTEAGRAQVAEAAVRLRRERIDMIMASDLSRTRETAEATGVPCISAWTTQGR